LFDPTVFDNLKVVLEGSVYDLDLSGSVIITNRSDQVDLSTMSRHFSIRFSLSGQTSPYAEIRLVAHLRDLAAEILEQHEEAPGCSLEIIFQTQVTDPNSECVNIQNELSRLWQHRPKLSQELTYTFGQQITLYNNEIILDFGRKVNEEQIDDFPELLTTCVNSLKWLGA
jgi:hypothetical protein